MTLLGVRDIIQNGRQMAVILDFTKNLNLSGKLGNCKYFFSRAVNYDTIKHFSTFVCVLKVFTSEKGEKYAYFYSKIA